jgi:hypothetical protein
MIEEVCDVISFDFQNLNLLIYIRVSQCFSECDNFHLCYIKLVSAVVNKVTAALCMRASLQSHFHVPLQCYVQTTFDL